MTENLDRQRKARRALKLSARYPGECMPRTAADRVPGETFPSLAARKRTAPGFFTFSRVR